MIFDMAAYHGGKHCLKQGISRWLKTAFFGVTVAVYATSATISTAAAQDTPQCHVDSTRHAIMRKAARGDVAHLMRLAEAPWHAGGLAFQSAEGKTMRLADFKGKVLLVNIWAVWCKPCRDEMPELAALQEKMGGTDFDVVALNVDRKPEGKVPDFLRKVGADRLPLYLDKNMATFQAAKQQRLAIGLPLSLLVDEDGCLLASFNGSARWGEPDAAAFIQTILKSKAGNNKTQ